uniref:tRNA pseudouridine synthase n=1 Tax=Glossina palpalis gambiensis TaxID=67801 RepID=A0A1B0B7B8_9MUSC
MSVKVQICRRLKDLTRDDLEKLTKTELVDKVIQLQSYNRQLKNILHKKLNESDNDDMIKLTESGELSKNSGTEGVESTETMTTIEPNQEKSLSRKFDFSKTFKRHVLLKLLYFGWNYQGFACQEDSNNTIEFHLFKALTRTCLIESRSSANYHRCGRTDKEVSAFCQVISIDLRSKFPEEHQFEEGYLEKEFDYCGIMNRVLPKNIRCISWMPIRNYLFSARFDCVTRTYRYFFPKGNLNISAMQDACKLLQRHTDFRNLCKMDVHNGVTNYVRHIEAANVRLCPHENESKNKGYAMHYLEIKANAFLWHQIRCIMAVLLLVGQEKEEPSVINELLNVEKNPCKPQYTPAVGFPLNLYHCEFRDKSEQKAMNESRQDIKDIRDLTKWLHSENNLRRLIENLQSEWSRAQIKATMIRSTLYDLEQLLEKQFNAIDVNFQISLLQEDVKCRSYQKLMNRKRCESLNNRIEHFVKKQRLTVPKQKDSVEVQEFSMP